MTPREKIARAELRYSQAVIGSRAFNDPALTRARSLEISAYLQQRYDGKVPPDAWLMYATAEELARWRRICLEGHRLGILQAMIILRGWRAFDVSRGIWPYNETAMVNGHVAKLTGELRERIRAYRQLQAEIRNDQQRETEI